MNAELKRLEAYGIKPNRVGVFIINGKQWVELPQSLKDDLEELVHEWDYAIETPDSKQNTKPT